MRIPKYIYIGILLSFVFSLTSCGDSWIETYDPSSDEPYGLSLFQEILKKRYDLASYQSLPRNWTVNGIDRSDSTLYVAVGNGLLYTPSEAEALAIFIETGGEALLASKEISNHFLSYIMADSCLYYKDLLPYNRLDSLERVVSASGSEFMMPVIRKQRGAQSAGNFINAADFDCLVGAEHLLMIQRDTQDFSLFNASSNVVHPIMSRFSHGQGHLTILSHPILFTNVFATDSLGRIAMEEVLKLLPSDVTQVVFDEQRRSSEEAVVKDNLPKNDNDFKEESNILKHVLARPPLAAAWYLLLLGSIIFLVFGSKRRQRMIPLVQPRRNTTHEHLGNISRLYLSQPNNALMAGKQFALFEAYCIRRFGLQPLQNEADYERFSKLAGVNLKHLETLKRYNHSVARNQQVSNSGFVSIVRILQAIYKGIGRRFD